MNNSNENNNEGLNVMSLGSVDNNTQNINVPINDIPPVTPISEEPVESLDDVPVQNVSEQPPLTSNEQVSGVIPENSVSSQVDINSIPGSVQPVSPINYDIPEVIDNSPVFNDIGTVPPINDIPVINRTVEPATPEVPNKKGMNKTLFVVIIILALCAVGAGVYLLLNKANKPQVVTKYVKIEAGSNLSTNIKDYATFKNIDASTCNFDTTEIKDTNVIGAEYKFRITCGSNSYIGKAKIVDTVAPDATLKEVNVGVNENVNVEDFIDTCKDASKCSYSFKDENKLKEYLNTAASYHVPIIVKDEAGNEKEVTGVLNVSESSFSSISLVCSKKLDNYLESTKLGLADSDSSFNKSTIRIYTFEFKDKSQYEKLRDENKNKKEMTYLNVIGTPAFDDDKMTLTLTKKIAYNDLVSEVGSEVPTTYGELKLFFEKKDYTCSLGF